VQQKRRLRRWRRVSDWKRRVRILGADRFIVIREDVADGVFQILWFNREADKEFKRLHADVIHIIKIRGGIWKWERGDPWIASGGFERQRSVGAMQGFERVATGQPDAEKTQKDATHIQIHKSMSIRVIRGSIPQR